MWTALFTIAIAAAIGFALAAWMSPDDASDARLAGCAATDWRVPSFATIVWRDASLFPRRLRLLHIDPDELACAEPVICRQLAIRCERCKSAMQCARDLSDDSTDPFGEEWRNYCPNAAVLSTIATLRGIDSSFSAGRRQQATTSPARS